VAFPEGISIKIALPIILWRRVYCLELHPFTLLLLTCLLFDDIIFIKEGLWMFKRYRYERDKDETLLMTPKQFDEEFIREIEAYEKEEPWLTSFGDLMMSMFVLFVLLYIMALREPGMLSLFFFPHRGPGPVEVKERAIFPEEEVSRYERFLEIDAKREDLLKKALEGKRVVYRISSSEEVYAVMAKIIEENNLEGVIDLELGKNSVRLRMGTDLLFSIGGTDLHPSGMEVLRKIAPVLHACPYIIRVVGHTDDLPVAPGNPRFKSNWGLSALRAAAVVEYFVEKEGINPRKFVVEGMGEYWPFVPNVDDKSRRRNRRVEILILDYSAPPPEA
jgi:chemotaxis protein MotB